MTHGLCGKEGAMVFKRVLKGIGRLMLTTAVMCGVGLFLCSSEVKAAAITGTPTADISINDTKESDDARYIIEVTNTNYDDDNTTKGEDITVDKIEFYKEKECTNRIAEFTFTENTVPGDVRDGSNNKKSFSITNKTFLQKLDKTNFTSGTSITVGGIKISYTGGNGSDIKIDVSTSSPAIITPVIYEIKAPTIDERKYDTDVDSSAAPTYTITATHVEGGVGYGYEGTKYTITSSASGENYYVNYGDGSAVWSDADAFISANTTFEGTFGTPPIPTKVQYFPKLSDLWYKSAVGTIYLDSKGQGSVSDIQLVLKNSSGDLKSNDRSVILAKMKIAPCSLHQPENGTNINKYSYETGADGILKLTFGDGTIHGLLSDDSPGIAKVKAIALKPNGGNGETPPINPVQTTSSDKYLSLNVYAQPTGIVFQNVPISVMAGGNATTVKIFNGIEPSGANQSLSSYTASLSVSQPGVIDVTDASFNSSTGEITVKANSTATAGATATVTLTLNNGITTPISNSFDVTIISFDKDKTISSIKNSNKNYITYNKDKGYSLDIKQLIVDNAKDSSGNSITIDKNQITGVKVGSTYCSEGTWKPSEASLNQKVSCIINGVEIKESDGLTVSSYPMPTATYSSSNRTLSVKIPTKVATAYSDDNNIRTSKGFKLLLVDSSGNTLYEYTDSKYQSVLSSSSESTVTYTVPAADIEGMITSAASNGKFSADTTSVKFKVIPMGYKQSSSSDETIKAKDEIAGTTDAVTVYKVSASGTNFSSTAAYGLDGQTVSITATPNSGYSFKQWSDGNTSNPRQVKVSASGTRSFQAVAGDRVANSTGAGGTDNSELYDDVPKTAESNSAIWLIVFMVFAVMGTTYALYLQLRAANSKHDR